MIVPCVTHFGVLFAVEQFNTNKEQTNKELRTSK